MKPPTFHDAAGVSVKPGDILLADGRLCLVQRRIHTGQQSVQGIEDLEIVEIQVNYGASSGYQTAAYGTVIGHLELKALR